MEGVKGARGPIGPIGKEGPAGSKGEQGEKGDRGPSGLQELCIWLPTFILQTFWNIESRCNFFPKDGSGLKKSENDIVKLISHSSNNLAAASGIQVGFSFCCLRPTLRTFKTLTAHATSASEVA